MDRPICGGSPRGDEVWFSATKGGRVSPLRAVSRSGQERIVLNLPGYIHLQEVLPDGRVLLAYGTARREVRCQSRASLMSAT